MKIQIVIFFWFVVSVLAQPILIYIDNSVNSAIQDGSQQYPYSSFNEAAIQNISEIMPSNSVTVMMAPTQLTYQIAFNNQFSGFNASSVLTFTTNGNNLGTLQCSNYAIVYTGGPEGSGLGADYLSIAFVNVQLWNFENGKYSYFYLETSISLTLTILNACISQFATKQNIFELQSQGPVSININTVSFASESEGNEVIDISTYLYLLSADQTNVAIANLNIELLPDSPMFNFLNINVTSDNIQNNFFSIVNTTLNRSPRAKFNNVMKSIIQLSGIGTVVVQNFALPLFNSEYQAIFLLDDFITLNVSNFSTDFTSCSDCYFFQAQSSYPVYIEMDNVNLYQSSQTGMLLLLADINYFKVSNFVFDSGYLYDSYMFLLFLMTGSKSLDPQEQLNIEFDGLQFNNSVMGGILFAQPYTGVTFDTQISIYQVYVKNLLVYGTNFYDGNAILISYSVPFLIKNSMLLNVNVLDTNFIQTNYTTGSVIISNFTIQHVNFSSSQFIQTDSFFEFPGKDLCYRVVSIDTSLFDDIWVDTGYSFISSEIPFTIFTRNIVNNIQGTQLYFLTMNQDTSYQNSYRNRTKEEIIFKDAPVVIEAFNYMLGKDSPYCSGDCYFDYIASNIFSNTNIYDSNHGSYLMSVSSLAYAEVVISQGNIFVDINGNLFLYLIPMITQSFIGFKDMISNVTGSSYVDFGSGAVVSYFEGLVVYKFDMEQVIDYTNITTIPFYELPSFILYHSVIYSGRAETMLNFNFQNLNLCDIAKNIFGAGIMQTTKYKALGAINIQIEFSTVNVTLDKNIFFDFAIINNISMVGFFPPLQNIFLQATMYSGCTINMTNNIFQNIYLGALLSTFLNIQAQSIGIYNTTMTNITSKNVAGCAITLSTPTLIVNNVSLVNLTSDSYESFVGTAGLMLLSYIDVYSSGFTNQAFFQNINCQNWVYQNYLFVLQSTFYQVYIENSTFNNVTEVFLIQSNGGYVFITNIFFGSPLNGVFASLSQKNKVPSILWVQNFTEENTDGLGNGFAAFLTSWTKINITISYARLKNASLISTQKFLGTVLIEHSLFSELVYGTLINLELQGGAADIVFRNISVKNGVFNEFIRIATHQTTINLIFDRFLITDSLINSPILYDEKFEAISNSSIKINSLILHNVTGKALFSIEIPLSGTLFDLTNSIFVGAKLPILLNKNANLVLTNIIQCEGLFLDEILDRGHRPRTSNLTNMTIYRILSSNSWLNVAGKSIGINSLVLAQSVNGISATDTKIYIENSIFYRNFIQKGMGGCINSQNSSVYLENSYIQENVATAGGFIFENVSHVSSALEIENSFVMNNTALMYGSMKATQVWKIDLTMSPTPGANTTFEEYYNATFISTGEGYQYHEYSLINASMYFSVNNYFNLTMYDYYGQQIQFGREMPMMLTIDDPLSGVSILRVVAIDPITNVIQFMASNITYPGNSQQIQIKLFVNIQGMIPEIVLNIQTRGCIAGEIIDHITQYCEMCPTGYYAFTTDSECIACPRGASCPGGRFLNVSENWWREPGTSNIYECLDDGQTRCQGGPDPSNQCATGYSGALCQGCDVSSGYTQSSGNICVKCESGAFALWFKNGFIILLTYLYEIGYIFLAFKSNKTFINSFIMKKNDLKKTYGKEDYLTAVHVFLLTNFLQLVFLIATYMSYVETNLVIVLDQLQFLLMISSSQTQQVSDFNCLLISLNLDPANITYYKLIFAIMFPWFKIIFTSSALIIKNFFYKVKALGKKIMIIFVSFIMLDQIGLLQQLSKMNTCLNGDIQGYSQMDPNISCSDPNFIQFRDEHIYPNLIAWGIVLPSIFLVLLLVFRKRRKEYNVRTILGGLMNNYEDHAFYWGLVLMGLKLGLLATFTLISDPRNATTLAIFLMALYLYLTTWVMPFGNQGINDTDKYTTFALLVSLILFNQAIGNLYLDMATIYAVLIFVIYAIVLCILSYRVLRRIYAKYKINRNKHRVMNFDGSMNASGVGSDGSSSRSDSILEDKEFKGVEMTARESTNLSTVSI